MAWLILRCYGLDIPPVPPARTDGPDVFPRVRNRYRHLFVQHLRQIADQIEAGNGSFVSSPESGIRISMAYYGLPDEVATDLGRRGKDSPAQGSAHHAGHGQADPGLGDKPAARTVDHEDRPAGLHNYIQHFTPIPRRCRHDGGACESVCSPYCERYDRRSSDGG